MALGSVSKPSRKGPFRFEEVNSIPYETCKLLYKSPICSKNLRIYDRLRFHVSYSTLAWPTLPNSRFLYVPRNPRSRFWDLGVKLTNDQYLTIAVNESGLRLAPPTKAPSISS